MMMNKQRQNTTFLSCTFILVLSFFTQGLFHPLSAQDIHFTQFDFNPLFINPANTGNYTGDWRAAALYRNQWLGTSEPYSTASVSLDKLFYILNQKIGAGVYFVNDESGPKLTYNKVYASVGYNRAIQNNSVGIGLQAGYVFGGIKPWQGYNPSTGIFDGPNNEPVLNDKTSYLDINFGLNYKRNISIFIPEAGISLLHLNKPAKSFVDDDEEKESMRYIFYVLVQTNITDKIYLKPKALISGIDGTSLMVAGLEGGYNLVGIKSTVKKVFVGAFIRNGSSGMNAMMAQVGASVGRIDIAVAYDMYLSNIKQAGNLSAFEISLIYKSLSTLLNSYSIPCERY